MELHSFNDIWQAGTVQHELAEHRICWIAEGQDESLDGRDGLGIFDGKVYKFLTDWNEASTGLEDVGNIFHRCRACFG